MYHKNNTKIWDKDIVKLLIIKYQEHENLYNVKHPMYEDRDKRSDSLYEICKKLKELNNSITVEDIKKKIHTLRTQYIKEFREIARMERSEPKLWCYYQLDFLRNHCTKRKCNLNYSNIDKCNQSNMVKEVPMEINSELPDYSERNMQQICIAIKNEPPDYSNSNIGEDLIDENTTNIEEEISIVIKSELPDYTKNNLEEVSFDVKSEPPTYLDSNMEKTVDVNSECTTYPKSNTEREVSIDLNSEHPSYPRCNKKRKSSKLEDRIDNVKSLLVKRLEEKSDYDWLGKQVVFEMKSIKNKKIQRDTAWKIQTILREASIEDATTSICQSEQLSSELQLETQSSFTSSSSKEQPMCSSFSSPSSVLQQSDSINRSASFSHTPGQHARPLQIISVNSCSTNTSYLTSQDVLQQPLDHLKDEEFQYL